MYDCMNNFFCSSFKLLICQAGFLANILIQILTRVRTFGCKTSRRDIWADGVLGVQRTFGLYAQISAKGKNGYLERSERENIKSRNELYNSRNEMN